MNTAAATNQFEAATAKHYRWEELPLETMKGTITRRLITSNRMMIAHVYLKKGDDVPRHANENEPIKPSIYSPDCSSVAVAGLPFVRGPTIAADRRTIDVLGETNIDAPKDHCVTIFP